jgi:hypothetical protein
MKFFLAWVVYLAMAAVLGAGIVAAVKGSPWLLLISVLVYLVAFAKLGCLPHH